VVEIHSRHRGVPKRGVTPPFWEKKVHMARDDEAARPMIDWLNNVQVADLAAELMAGFGPSGARDPNGGVSVND
jgi:hypothetical protein